MLGCLACREVVSAGLCRGSAPVTALPLVRTWIVDTCPSSLTQEGVSIEAVEAALRGVKVARSTTTILVKNLPATADERLLRERFSRFGALSRVVLAPSRIVGLVEFCDAVTAKYVNTRFGTGSGRSHALHFLFFLRFCAPGCTWVQAGISGAGVHQTGPRAAVPRVGASGCFHIAWAQGRCRCRSEGHFSRGWSCKSCWRG